MRVRGYIPPEPLEQDKVQEEEQRDPQKSPVVESSMKGKYPHGPVTDGHPNETEEFYEIHKSPEMEQNAIKPPGHPGAAADAPGDSGSQSDAAQDSADPDDDAQEGG